MKFKVSNSFISDVKSFVSGNGTQTQKVNGYMKLSTVLLCLLLAVNFDAAPIQKTIYTILTSIVSEHKETELPVPEPIDPAPPIIETNETFDTSSIIVLSDPDETIIDQPTVVTNFVYKIVTNENPIALKQRLFLTRIDLSRDKEEILEMLGLTKYEFDAIMSSK